MRLGMCIERVRVEDAQVRGSRARGIAERLEQLRSLTRRVDIVPVNLEERIERLDGPRGVLGLSSAIAAIARFGFCLPWMAGQELRGLLERADGAGGIARLLPRTGQTHVHGETVGIGLRHRRELLHRGILRNVDLLQRFPHRTEIALERRIKSGLNLIDADTIGVLQRRFGVETAAVRLDSNAWSFASPYVFTR